MSEPEVTQDRQRRAIRRSTILWAVVALILVMIAAGNWMRLAVDGGGSPYTWAMAIGSTVVAVFTTIFIVTFRHATRTLRRPDSDRQS